MGAVTTGGENNAQGVSGQIAKGRQRGGILGVPRMMALEYWASSVEMGRDIVQSLQRSKEW